MGKPVPIEQFKAFAGKRPCRRTPTAASKPFALRARLNDKLKSAAEIHTRAGFAFPLGVPPCTHFVQGLHHRHRPDSCCGFTLYVTHRARPWRPSRCPTPYPCSEYCYKFAWSQRPLLLPPKAWLGRNRKYLIGSPFRAARRERPSLRQMGAISSAHVLGDVSGATSVPSDSKPEARCHPNNS